MNGGFSSSDFYSFPARACSYSLTPSFFIAENRWFWSISPKIVSLSPVKDSSMCEVGVRLFLFLNHRKELAPMKKKFSVFFGLTLKFRYSFSNFPVQTKVIP
jgi:hypothetical protein